LVWNLGKEFCCFGLRKYGFWSYVFGVNFGLKKVLSWLCVEFLGWGKWLEELLGYFGLRLVVVRRLFLDGLNVS